MRVAIIGVGVAGSMAAWRLAQAGHDVVAFEQFSLDHDNGSSYGDSRIVRRVYPDAFYTSLMADAYPLWYELQAACPNEEIFSPIGGVLFGKSGHPEIEQAHQSLAAQGIEYQIFDAAECNRRYPAFNLRAGEIALYEPSMGFARASRAVRAAASLARKRGAVIHENTSIVEVLALASGGIRLETDGHDKFEADKLLICAGPWASRVIAPLGLILPLTTTRKTYIHLRPAQYAEAFEIGQFPAWADVSNWLYGFPRLGDVPGVKLAQHSGGDAVDVVDVDRSVRHADRQPLLQYASERFPWLGDEVLYEKVCLYTRTPDEDFIIDAIPGLDGAFLISACSGHGFKFGPLIGQICVNLVNGTTMPYDLARFGLGRFSTT